MIATMAAATSISNQRATELMAALLVVAQPAPVNSAAAKSCQGACAMKVMTPGSHNSAPAQVTVGKGQWSSGK